MVTCCARCDDRGWEVVAGWHVPCREACPGHLREVGRIMGDLIGKSTVARNRSLNAISYWRQFCRAVPYAEVCALLSTYVLGLGPELMLLTSMPVAGDVASDDEPEETRESRAMAW